MSQDQILQAARRSGGFVWQTMGQRGLTCSRQDITTALAELAPAQVLQVQAAAMSLAKGADDAKHFDLLRALRLVSAVDLRHALHDHAIEYRAELLFHFAAESPERVEFLRLCQQAHGADASLSKQALVELRQRLGALGDHAAPAGAVSPDESHVALPAQLVEDTPKVSPTHAPALRRSAARPTTPCDPSPATAPAAAVRHRQTKVFGQSAALTWEIAALADQDPDQPPLCTVMIEGAVSDGAGRYRWDEKTVFMLTLRELPQVLGVLMGWSSELEFRFHGKQKKKALVIEHQDHGLHVRLSDGPQRLSVPIDDGDRYPLCMLVLAALCANEPTLDSQAVLAVCRAMTQAARRSN